MAANIYGRHYAERNGYAWWGSGVRLENHDGKATTAVRVSGNNFPVNTRPLYFYDDDGALIESDNVAITRPADASEGETHSIQLGSAKAGGYTPISNYRVAELLDPLTDRWPVETCGSLGKGEDFFLTLNAGRATIAGDDIDQFMFLWNKHDGTSALRVMFTPVRVVCQNTCILGASRANVTTSVIHSRNVEQETAFALDLAVRLQQAQQDSMGELARFPGLKLYRKVGNKLVVDSDTISRVLALTYPIKPRTRNEERAVHVLTQQEQQVIQLSVEEIARFTGVELSRAKAIEKARKLRALAYERMQAFNEEHPNAGLAYTGWALYNAITEIETHTAKPNQAFLRQLVDGGERGKNVAACYGALVAVMNGEELPQPDMVLDK